MTAKEKAIKEAYGEHWEAVKDYVDENGWVYTQEKHFNNLIGLSHSNLQTTPFNFEMEYYWRPKSLQGIETNNGWIKIESEDDLPKEEKPFWVLNDENQIVEMEYFPKYKTFTEEGVTHYQPITKPQPPIY